MPQIAVHVPARGSVSSSSVVTRCRIRVRPSTTSMEDRGTGMTGSDSLRARRRARKPGRRWLVMSFSKDDGAPTPGSSGKR